MKSVIRNIMLGALLLVSISGCGTMTLETGAKNTRTIVIDHSKNIDKSIYVQVTNTANSGGEYMNLDGSIQKALVEKGYTIASTSDNASYGLFVNVLFANSLTEANAIKAAAGAGITSSIIAMGSGSNTSDSLLIGATAALAGSVGAKIFEDETFKAVIDVNVKGYKDDLDEKTRIFVEAVKMNLVLEEAMPILEKESTRSIVNIF